MDSGCIEEQGYWGAFRALKNSSSNSLLENILILGRVSNLPSVWTNCLAAWAINLCSQDWVRAMPDWKEPDVLNLSLLFPLLIGASLLYAGGCTLNDAFDQNFDARHNPQRPIPSGSISSTTVWTVGITELLVGVLTLHFFAHCEIHWILCLVVCITLYDMVHKKWKGGVILMGGCRLLLWATAATCGDLEGIYPLTWIWGTTLFLYVIGISLYARGEAKEDEDPSRISILFLFAPPMIALAALIHWNNLDPIRVFLANLTGLVIAWIAFDSILRMKEGKKGAIGLGVSRLLAGICVTDAVVVSFCMPMLIAPMLCLNAFALWMQKRFAAT